MRLMKVPEIELTSAAICSNRGKDVHVWAETDIIDLFIVCNQLSEHGSFLDIPNRARGVDG